jgi:hypothetical protein
MKSLILAILVLAACGRQTPSTSASQTPSSANGNASLTGGDPCTVYDNCQVQGSVAGSFQLTVDGAPYQNIEGYYTYEIENLQKQCEKLGYTDCDFAAQLGLSDFQYGQTVAVENSSGQGFSGTGEVMNNSQFAIYDTDTSDSTTSTFNVLVNKRITLTTSTQEFCYNFSGAASQVRMNNPVIVDTYTTQFTLYACDANGSGISLPAPAAPAVPAAPATATATSTATGTSN